MKRIALLKLLARRGCSLFREGSRHSVFWNPLNRKFSTIPRHREIDDDLARKICRDLGVQFRD
jgi:mRNA interferase HicA